MKTKAISENTIRRSYAMRLWCAAVVLMLCAAVLVGRAFHLQVLENHFLTHEADVRHLLVAKISAHRGTITDRNGEPLAVSTV